MSERFAIYAAPPPGTPLWRFGSRAIGYDAETGEALPAAADMPADATTWAAFTAEPRAYGFHGTLKAPFRLREGATFGDVATLAEDLAAGLAPVRVPRLAVRLIGSFVALVPAEPCPPLDAIAAAAVRAFEPLRAPLTEAERARRLTSPLTPRQIELLDAYGYPHVFDQFRFHLTLTGRLPPDRAEGVRSRLDDLYGGIEPGLDVASLCVFVQDAPASPFRIRRRVQLRG